MDEDKCRGAVSLTPASTPCAVARIDAHSRVLPSGAADLGATAGRCCSLRLPTGLSAHEQADLVAAAPLRSARQRGFGWEPVRVRRRGESGRKSPSTGSGSDDSVAKIIPSSPANAPVDPPSRDRMVAGASGAQGGCGEAGVGCRTATPRAIGVSGAGDAGIIDSPRVNGRAGITSDRQRRPARGKIARGAGGA